MSFEDFEIGLGTQDPMRGVTPKYKTVTTDIKDIRPRLGGDGTLPKIYYDLEYQTYWHNKRKKDLT